MLQTTIRTLPGKRALLTAGVTAALALVAMGFSGGAQARSDVSFSVGVVLPGVVVGVSNAYPVYNQPVYVQPAPVYVQPRVIYRQPQPVYVQPQVVYVQPEWSPPGRAYGWKKHHGKKDRDDDRYGRYERDDGERGDYRRSGYDRGDSRRSGGYVQIQAQVPQPYEHGSRGFEPAGSYYKR
jgi:hypothetical protein